MTHMIVVVCGYREGVFQTGRSMFVR